MSKQDPKPKKTHVLSVDVEDYFQVEAFAGSVDRKSWDLRPSRVVANTHRVLDLFDQHNAKGTFFFVGWVAERFPHLCARSSLGGMSLPAIVTGIGRSTASRPMSSARTRGKLSTRLRMHRACPIAGYRAPSWSITKSCLWALDILAEEGFTYDSSIYPIHHDLYGVPGAQRFPYTHDCTNGLKLREFPPATLRVLGTNFPAAGGGYLRIFPSAFTELAFRTFEKKYDERVVVYLHPWELDPEQPRISGPLKSRVRHYTNLKHMHAKLNTVLSRRKFQPFKDVMIAEAAEANAQQSARHSSGLVGDKHLHEPLHAVAHIAKGRR